VLRSFIRLYFNLPNCSFGSFFNHSCSPNIELRGSKDMHVFAVRDIAAGEQLCLSYLSLETLDMNMAFRCPSLKFFAEFLSHYLLAQKRAIYEQFWP
jgi:hypothetical protein